MRLNVQYRDWSPSLWSYHVKDREYQLADICSKTLHAQPVNEKDGPSGLLLSYYAKCPKTLHARPVSEKDGPSGLLLRDLRMAAPS